MRLEFLHWWPLVGVLGLGLFWWGHRRSATPFSASRRRLSLALRGLVFLLLLLALCEPRWIGQRRAQCVVWLVDASRSLGDEGIKRALAFWDAAEKAGQFSGSEAVAHRHQFIAFAGKPLDVNSGKTGAVFAPSSAAPPTPSFFSSLATPFSASPAKPDFKSLAALQPKLEDDATDIAAALAYAEASFPPGYAKTMLLFTDGQETRGEAASALPRLNTAGVRVFPVAVEPPDRPEVLVRSVSAPAQAGEDEPFEVVAEIVSSRETEAEVEIFRNGPRLAAKTVALKKGVNLFKITQSVSGEKADEFSVSVRAKEDTIADNNRASAFVRSTGKAKALLLADQPEAARYLARALQQEGIALDVRPPRGAPTEMGDLQNYDLLLLDNVPATELSTEQMRLFASYVRDFGGGLLMLGGEQSFGLGGYYRTPVEEVLPVQCHFEKEQENPALALLLVIDRSGSMSGEPIEMAKEAAKAAVELLGGRDYVGVVAFDHESFWVVELQGAGDKIGVQQKISTIEAGGGTSMAPALEMALSKIQSSPAKLKHVIAFTDGMSEAGPFYELATQMAQQKITLSTVGLGGSVDQELLKQMAEWGGGRYYFTDNPSSIPQIFTKETMTAAKSAIRDVPFVPIPVATGIGADFLCGVDFSTTPFLLGYVNTRLKPTAELWLASEKKEPLLASWRYGLGQAGAFTSDARNRWAVDWLKWEGYGKFWAQVARKFMRPAALKHQPSRLMRVGDEFHFSVDALDANGNYASDLSGELTLLDPDQRTMRLPLEAVAPGKLEARWPARHGVWHTQLALRKADGGEVLDQQYASVSAGYSDEFLPRPADAEKLRAMAAATGGTLNPAALAELRNDRGAPVEWELWPWLAALALLFFVADVASRRWPDGRLEKM